MTAAAVDLHAPGKGLPRTAVWAGRAMSGLVALFLAMDAAMKFADLPPVRQTTAQLGFPHSSVLQVAVLEVLCLALYLVPRTAAFGALLLTGLLGGTVAAHLRTGDPLFTHVLFGVYVGVLAWGGLWLRDEAVRALLPLRRAR
jgi:hypothetical protein